MKQYLRLFIKSMMHWKEVSALALGSLSVGIAVVVLIGLWVQEEFSFDRFHTKGDGIYRVYTCSQGEREGIGTFRQLGDNMKDKFPEVKEICRTAYSNSDYRVDKISFQDIAGRQVEENFFSFFSFPLKSGDARTCLDAPNKIVISESVAQKWFPGQDPIGRLVGGDKMNWQVSAVMKDIPYNSHIQSDVIVPFYDRTARPDCPADLFTTYLYITDVSHIGDVEQKLTRINWATNSLMEEMKQEIKLQALKDIHFSGLYSDNMGSKSLVVTLGLTALAILLIACINFINLFIATSFMRVKEIGVKKTFGAGKTQLIKSFYSETFAYVLLATGIGFFLALLCRPLFNRLADYQLMIGFNSPWLYAFLGGVVVFTTLVAGSYPAFYMTRFSVIDTVSRQFRGKRLSFFQNSLLVLQFTVSIAFLIMIFFVHKQVNYVVDYDLGFNKENIIYMPAEGDMFDRYEAVRGELLRNPRIKEVSLRQGVPMSWADGYPVQRPGSGERFQFELCQIKPNFLDMMGIQMVEGENPFYNEQVKNHILIDEKGVQVLGLKEPVGTRLNIWGVNFIIKGVVRTTQNKILKNKNPSPLLYLPVIDNMADLFTFYFMCRVEGNPREAIGAMEKQWQQFVPDMPFTYRFLDQAYAELYESDLRLAKIFLCALVIMVLLSITGLFAVAYYKSERQLKDIGIRRVNGATGWDLLILLNTGFMYLVGIAVVVAIVLSYYFISLWLEDFSVRTSLSGWVFIGAGLIAVVVALVTVCTQVIRVTKISPVKILKSE